MPDTMFTYDDLSRLLDRYEAGETTLEEERRLKAYFNQPAIDERLRDWAPLFQALVVERTVVKPAGETPLIVRKGGGYRVSYRWYAAAAALALVFFAWRMLITVEPIADPAFAHTEQIRFETPPAPTPVQNEIEQTPAPPTQKLHKRHKIRPLAALPTPAPVPDQTEIEDPEQALAEIKAALALVSSKMKKSRQELGKNLHHLEAMDQVVKFPAGTN